MLSWQKMCFITCWIIDVWYKNLCSQSFYFVFLRETFQTDLCPAFTCKFCYRRHWKLFSPLLKCSWSLKAMLTNYLKRLNRLIESTLLKWIYFLHTLKEEKNVYSCTFFNKSDSNWMTEHSPHDCASSSPPSHSCEQSHPEPPRA